MPSANLNEPDGQAPERPAGYELTLNGKQVGVAGEKGFPSGDLEAYLKHGFVISPLYRK